MSNEFIKAADDARRLLRGFQAFAEVAAALDKVGVAVQSADEAEKALAAARGQLEGVLADVEKAKAEALAHSTAAKKTTADAKTVADGIVAAAQAKAAAIEQQALALAAASDESIVANKAQAEQALAAIALQVDAQTEIVKDLEARAEKARTYLAKLAS